jgi:hypothetical protein
MRPEPPANDAPMITFSHDVMVEARPLAAS